MDHVTMDRVTVAKQGISAQAARLILEAAVAEAERLELAATIAVVDESGVLKGLIRMDNSLLAGVQVAQDKAYSSASTTYPTSAWLAVTDSSKEFALGLYSLPRICPLAGGVPLVVDGQVVGAVGVSGGMPDQDEQIATVAAAAITTNN